MDLTMGRTFDLDLLRTFVTVIDAGGFTAAARRLNATQSTVSMQIRRLEQAVERPLFRRSGRAIELTVDGERLQAHARDMLQRNDEAWRDLAGPTVTGRLRVGIPDDYAFYIPEIIRDFSQQYPGVDLRVQCDLSVALVELVRAGSMDMALVTRQPNTPGGEVLRRESLVWVASPTHAPEHQDPLPLSLFPREACVFRDVATRALDAAGRTWRAIYTSKTMSGQQAFVGAGLAVTVLTRSQVAPDLRVLDESSGLPALPPIELALHRQPGRPTEPARRLTAMVRERLAHDAAVT
jgi:DNA-binding transcriptional LysR family regulator